MSVFYGLAIRRNKDSVKDMKTEIWATLKHRLSTDTNPQHDSCPPGDDSWCTWQKANARRVNWPSIHINRLSAIMC